MDTPIEVINVTPGWLKHQIKKLGEPYKQAYRVRMSDRVRDYWIWSIPTLNPDGEKRMCRIEVDRFGRHEYEVVVSSRHQVTWCGRELPDALAMDLLCLVTDFGKPW